MEVKLATDWRSYEKCWLVAW